MFSFGILDNWGSPLPTSGFSGSLLDFSIDSETPPPSVFAGDGSAAWGGVVVEPMVASAVPEPGSLLLFPAGAGLLLWRRRRSS